MREPCIVAMGGGGFSMEPDNPWLDDYLLSLVDSAAPRVCFLPTASGDADNYVVRFYDAFGHGRSVPTHLALFQRSIDDLRAFILDQDILYVGGGIRRPVRVLSLEALVRIKLASFRDKDRMHLRDMIDVGLVDATWCPRFPAELASRLSALIATPEGIDHHRGASGPFWLPL